MAHRDVFPRRPPCCSRLRGAVPLPDGSEGERARGRWGAPNADCLKPSAAAMRLSSATRRSRRGVVATCTTTPPEQESRRTATFSRPLRTPAEARTKHRKSEPRHDPAAPGRSRVLFAQTRRVAVSERGKHGVAPRDTG